MRKIVIALAAAALLTAPASACAPLTGGGVFDSTLADEKGLYAAEAAYFGAGTALEAAVDAGLVRGERAAQAARLERSAYSALVIARRAQAAGNTGDAAVAAAQVLGAVAELQKLLNPQPG